MKLYRAIRFLLLPGLLALLLSGCIKESLEGCPLDTRLRFTYKPQGALAELFGERVQRVTLCVYRPDGSIEQLRVLEKAELDRLQGADLYLPQGSYTVVLWANATETNTLLGGFSEDGSMADLFASHPQASGAAVLPTLDRLLFAATPLTVSEHDAATERIVNFIPATMRISVQLDGISVQPIIRFTGMASAVQPVQDTETGTWSLRSVDQDKEFRPAVSYDPSTRHATAVVDVPRFGENTPGLIEIIDPATGNPIVAPISLADLIRRYHIPLEGDIEVNIPIEISFGGGYTKISVKGWEHTPIHPGGI